MLLLLLAGRVGQPQAVLQQQKQAVQWHSNPSLVLIQKQQQRQPLQHTAGALPPAPLPGRRPPPDPPPPPLPLKGGPWGGWVQQQQSC